MEEDAKVYIFFVGAFFNDKTNYKIIGIQGHIHLMKVIVIKRLKIEKEIENLLNIKPKRQTAKHAYDKQVNLTWFHLILMTVFL